MIRLRDYQQGASDAILAWVRKSTDPCCIEAPTGAGKSIIIADVCKRIHDLSGKKVLVLAPSEELVMQDYYKYIAYGMEASVFCASAGMKSTVHNVIFGSPISVKNSINKFRNKFSAVIIDEAHGITPTIKFIIDRLKNHNGNLRVIGLTATPYRLGSGYIYEYRHDTGRVHETETIDPFFKMLVYSIDARDLIARGFLAQPVFDETDIAYDTSGVVLNKTGKFDSDSVDRAFVGKGRLTSDIVADIVHRCKGMNAVIIFAATVQHAKEIMESLPESISRLVTGETPKAEREEALSMFNAKQIKYLVNVAVLTTGFDAPHIECVAILRATESAGLLQQIIGRGLRIDEGKYQCLILDYAENVERHFPHGDVFQPEIKARRSASGEPVEIQCPLCGEANTVSLRDNIEGYKIDTHGYFIDLMGNRIMGDNGEPMPSHYGRRCSGFKLVRNEVLQCEHRWFSKRCPECEHDNDIAARYCEKCRAELVDPNEKLLAEAAKMARDPYRIRESNVIRWLWRRHSNNGKPDTLRVTYFLEDGKELNEWYGVESLSSFARRRWLEFSNYCGVNANTIAEALATTPKMPEKVQYKKRPKSKYFDIVNIVW